MSKATTLTLASTLGMSDVDATEAGKHYDDIVRELGSVEALTASGSVSVTAGTNSYAPPSNTINILEVHGQAAGVLDQATIRGLQAVYGLGWNDRTGTPIAFVRELQTDKNFQLVPNPTQADTLTVLHTQYRENVPIWLELAIAHEILHREFLRESDHQDVAYAELCRGAADLLFGLVGVSLPRPARG